MGGCQKILDGVVFIKGQSGGTFPFCNSYLVKDRGELVVIDPQCGIRSLQQGLELLNSTFADISAVLATHFHVDHTTPCRWLSEQFHVPIFMHEYDASAVVSWNAMASRYRIETPMLRTMLFRVFYGIAGFRPFRVTHPFQAADALPGGIEAVHSPGHTPGHCAFIFKKLLFSGDVELNVPWVGNVNSSVEEFLTTTESLATLDLNGILPGHGDPVLGSGCYRRLREYRAKLLRIAEAVYQELDGVPATLDQIVESSRKFLSRSVRGKFKAENDLLLVHFEKIAMSQYLKYLEALGRARRSVDDDGRNLWSRIS